MLTFDDGYLDNFVYAHPVLKAFGLRATLFIVTGWLGDGPVRRGAHECPEHRECKRRIGAGASDSVMLRWSEVEEMQLAGTFEFHSHTHTHTRWDKTLPDGVERIGAMTEELKKSREIIKDRLGFEDRQLCWPQGYFQENYVELAAGLGFDYCYTTRPTINRCGGDRGHIGRIVTKETDGAWTSRRLRVYASPWLGGLYNVLKGRQ